MTAAHSTHSIALSFYGVFTGVAGIIWIWIHGGVCSNFRVRLAFGIVHHDSIAKGRLASDDRLRDLHDGWDSACLMIPQNGLCFGVSCFGRFPFLFCVVPSEHGRKLNFSAHDTYLPTKTCPIVPRLCLGWHGMQERLHSFFFEVCFGGLRQKARCDATCEGGVDTEVVRIGKGPCQEEGDGPQGQQRRLR